jgi:hypothetical protein
MGLLHRSGSRVGGLLRYLSGPGKSEEPVNPQLVAAWDGAGPLMDLEPKVTASGKPHLSPDEHQSQNVCQSQNLEGIC